MEITEEQIIEKIKSIAGDKYAVGAFSGMIYNQFEAKKTAGFKVSDERIGQMIKDAAKIRLILESF